jgi:hypothetical protein
MTSPNNRSTPIIFAVFGLAMFAIAFFGVGADSQFAYATQILIATAAVFIGVQGLFLRDPIILLMGASAGVLAYGVFNRERIVTYIGMAVFLGAFLLMTRKYKKLGTPRPTGV